MSNTGKMRIRLAIWAAMSLGLCGVGAETAVKTFVMPVKASAFEIQNRHLLAMGENALDTRDFEGALNYFHELRGKLAKDTLTSDYALASALLAESCLAFPKGTVLKLGAPNDGRVDTMALAGEIMSREPAGNIAADVGNYYLYIKGRYFQMSGNLVESDRVLTMAWGAAEKRRERLKDLYNWILLAKMQTLAMQADGTVNREKAMETWRAVLALSKEWIEKLSIVTSSGVEDAAQARVKQLAGQSLRRSPRKNALPVEQIRLRACALLSLDFYKDAEAELMKPAMGVYASERNWLLTTCLAGQNRVVEACEQYVRSEQDHPLKPGAAALEAAEVRMAYWAMFAMHYRGERFNQAESFLERLEPLLRPADRFRWLTLELQVQHGRMMNMLRQADDAHVAELAMATEKIRNGVLKYAALFPEICQRKWLDFVSALPAAQQGEYYSLLAAALHSLGQAETRLGNVNSAMELFGMVGKCTQVSDNIRYDCWMALGDVAAGDIRMSIQAFKNCEGLRRITAEQKSVALYCAAQRALKEASRDGAPQAEKLVMGNEGESLLKHLCADYAETPRGRDALAALADYYYGQKQYSMAIPYYQRYYRSRTEDIRRRDSARLRWSRCWRLLAETAKSKDSAPTPQELQLALDNLAGLRGESPDTEIRDQAYLESYRVAFAMGDEAFGMKMLDMVIELNRDAKDIGDAVWVALYERMLLAYQRNKLDDARKDGELFLAWRGDRGDMTPWCRELYVLYGDILAATQEWDRACTLYLKLEMLDKSETQDALTRYAIFESAHCYYMKGEYAKAFEQLSNHLQAKSDDSRSFAYQSAILSGNIKQALGEYLEAAHFFEIAQGIFGQADTYKTNLAKCRQGEMFLMASETAMAKVKDKEAGRQEALRHLERASEIFLNLLDTHSSEHASAEDKDHCFDLYLRTQFLLGQCYEAVPKDDPAAPEAKTNALWCYKRIGDFFVERYRSGEPMRCSQFYVKSLDRRVRLLTAGQDPVNYDMMDTVARLYEEYARMDLEGSKVAKMRAEEIRKHWR